MTSQFQLPIRQLAVSVAIISQLMGCAVSRLWTRVDPVFDSSVTKEQLVEHVNRNILGSEDRPGLAGWKTSDASVKVSMLPSAPASIAVEAPRNLRILVTNPLSGAQEVDLGSNREQFWIWSKEQPDALITCRHEDTAFAVQYANMPIPIQPQWLLEVFGVIPIDGSEYALGRNSAEHRLAELVAIKELPTGERVEKIIRINTQTGHIEQHLIRQHDGTLVASAELDQYVQMPNGTSLPTLVRVTWPEQDVQLKISLGHPEVNPPSFAVASTLWELPNSPTTRVVDIGRRARLAAGSRGHTTAAEPLSPNISRPIRQTASTQPSGMPTSTIRTADGHSPAGRATLTSSTQLQAPPPAGSQYPRSIPTHNGGQQRSEPTGTQGSFLDNIERPETTRTHPENLIHSPPPFPGSSGDATPSHTIDASANQLPEWARETSAHKRSTWQSTQQ